MSIDMYSYEATQERQDLERAEAGRAACGHGQHEFVLIRSTLGDKTLEAGCLRGCGQRIIYGLRP